MQLAQRERGLSLRVGYETEFTLLQKPQAAAAAGGGERGPGGVPPPLDGSVYCQSSSFDGAAEGERCLHELGSCGELAADCRCVLLPVLAVPDEVCATLSAPGLDV